MVSPGLVEELRIIIKEEYQVDLEPQEVSEIANTLVNFFNLLTKIELEDNNNQIEEGVINGL
jgi:hypothetical protein